MYEDLKWQALESRRDMQRLTLLFKILNGKAPVSLSELKPSFNTARNAYTTRNINNLDAPKCKTEQYAKSFFPSTVKTWNLLPREKRSLTQSLESFKVGLKTKK